MKEYSKLMKGEITAFILLFFIYIVISPLKNIDNSYILFSTTIFLSLIVVSKIYYSKYKSISYKNTFTISIFTSLFATIVKDFFKIENHYFAIFLVVLFVPFYFLSIRGELSKINEELKGIE